MCIYSYVFLFAVISSRPVDYRILALGRSGLPVEVGTTPQKPAEDKITFKDVRSSFELSACLSKSLFLSLFLNRAYNICLWYCRVY